MQSDDLYFLAFRKHDRRHPERGFPARPLHEKAGVTRFLGALFAGMMKWSWGREPDRRAGGLSRPGETH